MMLESWSSKPSARLTISRLQKNLRTVIQEIVAAPDIEDITDEGVAELSHNDIEN